MAGFLDIRTRSTVTGGKVFDCEVYVVAATPGSDITVRLSQASGLEPYFSSRQNVFVNTDGGALAIFQVTLNGPCVARLRADDVSSALPLAGDEARIQVVP